MLEAIGVAALVCLAVLVVVKVLSYEAKVNEVSDEVLLTRLTEFNDFNDVRKHNPEGYRFSRELSEMLRNGADREEAFINAQKLVNEQLDEAKRVGKESFVFRLLSDDLKDVNSEEAKKAAQILMHTIDGRGHKYSVITIVGHGQDINVQLRNQS